MDSQCESVFSAVDPASVSSGHFFSIVREHNFYREIGHEYLLYKPDLQWKRKLLDGLIVVVMQARRSPRMQQRRHRSRHAGVRTFVEWLTMIFVIACLICTVVLLILYEWHAIHPHPN